MRISEINIYPVKSLGGISVEKSIVEKRGFQNDRRFMIVDKNGKFLSQREISKMATIHTDILDDKIKLSSVEPFDSLSIDLANKFEKEINVQVWQSVCKGLLADEYTNNWFSDVLETECFLVQMPDSTERQINKKFNKGREIVSFADGYPYLLIGENSLHDLNKKLDKQISMNRFRPNIVVEGFEAFAEDNWKKIRIGETIFRVTKPCARCVITTIDQETGIKEKSEPLKTLASYRKASEIYPENYQDLDIDENAVLFGQNLVAENFGEELKIGDEIEILEEF